MYTHQYQSIPSISFLAEAEKKPFIKSPAPKFSLCRVYSNVALILMQYLKYINVVNLKINFSMFKKK